MQHGFYEPVVSKTRRLNTGLRRVGLGLPTLPSLEKKFGFTHLWWKCTGLLGVGYTARVLLSDTESRLTVSGYRQSQVHLFFVLKEFVWGLMSWVSMLGEKEDVQRKLSATETVLERREKELLKCQSKLSKVQTSLNKCRMELGDIYRQKQEQDSPETEKQLSGPPKAQLEKEIRDLIKSITLRG